jgi:hypothetical protein
MIFSLREALQRIAGIRLLRRVDLKSFLYFITTDYCIRVSHGFSTEMLSDVLIPCFTCFSRLSSYLLGFLLSLPLENTSRRNV